MDAKEAQVKEKFEFHLKQATELAAQLQAIEQGDRVPYYDEIELPAHDMGQRFSRGIQEERVRELALREFKGCRCPDCKQLVQVEIEVRPATSMDGPIELTEPVAHCRPCRRSFFPSACQPGTVRRSEKKDMPCNLAERHGLEKIKTIGDAYMVVGGFPEKR